jgi:hypothetical protein
VFWCSCARRVGTHDIRQKKRLRIVAMAVDTERPISKRERDREQRLCLSDSENMAHLSSPTFTSQFDVLRMFKYFVQS